MSNVGMNLSGVFTPGQDRRITQEPADTDMQAMGRIEILQAVEQFRLRDRRNAYPRWIRLGETRIDRRVPRLDDVAGNIRVDHQRGCHYSSSSKTFRQMAGWFIGRSAM